MWCGNSAEEELRTIGVLATISHGQDAWSCVLVDEVLVLKLGTINGFATRSISLGEVTSLTHETRNHSVELASFVSVSILTCAKLFEVSHCLRDIFLIQFRPACFPPILMSKNAVHVIVITSV